MSTRGPQVTAKRSLSFVAATREFDKRLPDAAGKLMCETGHDAVAVCVFWFLKEDQYRCSGVTGLGPVGSFNCARGSTSAAIFCGIFFGGCGSQPVRSGVSFFLFFSFLFFFFLFDTTKLYVGLISWLSYLLLAAAAVVATDWKLFFLGARDQACQDANKGI